MEILKININGGIVFGECHGDTISIFLEGEKRTISREKVESLYECEEVDKNKSFIPIVHARTVDREIKILGAYWDESNNLKYLTDNEDNSGIIDIDPSKIEILSWDNELANCDNVTIKLEECKNGIFMFFGEFGKSSYTPMKNSRDITDVKLVLKNSVFAYNENTCFGIYSGVLNKADLKYLVVPKQEFERGTSSSTFYHFKGLNILGGM